MEISFVETGEGIVASKAYADACWRRWMRLSPDYWRESLGETVGKVWRDARDGVDCEAAGWGVNGVYGPQTEDFTGKVGVVELAGDPAGWAEMQAESVVWRLEQGAEPDEAGLAVMEGWVQRGVVSHYGLAGFVPEKLGAWIQKSETAAERVWGRRKRPGLRCVVVRANVLEMDAFVMPLVEEVRHGQREVLSVAELAARRGWRIVVEDALAWQVPQVGVIELAGSLPDESGIEDAVAALTRLVEAEDMLDEALGGWPMADDKPLWRAGALLGQGQPLWPGMQALVLWQQDVWPAMRRMVEGFGGEPELLAAKAGYVAAVEQILDTGAETLAALASQRIAAAVMAQVRAAMGLAEQARWEGVPDSALAVALMASVPGVSGVLVSGSLVGRESWVRAIQMRPDMADTGRIFRALGVTA